MELNNAIYKIIIDELVPRENKGMLKGNAHHIAQALMASILEKIKEKEPKRKETKTFIACYKSNDRWRLITREIATLAHATKKANAYKEAGHQIKIIPIEL
jgi:hypothetical protein